MKTKKIFISAAMIALATTSFGQKGSMIEKLFPNKADKVQYHSVEYVAEPGRTKNQGISLLNRLQFRNTDVYDTPVIERTIYAINAEVMYESEIELESWMAMPFENIVTEKEMVLESWMTVPFEATGIEDELSIEPWMTAPFESKDASLERCRLVKTVVRSDVVIHDLAFPFNSVHL